MVSCTCISCARNPYNRLVVKDYGNCTLKVEGRGLRQRCNTVDLKFGSPADGGYVMKCTCDFCMRYAIPGRQVLGAVKSKPLCDGYDTLREDVPALCV